MKVLHLPVNIASQISATVKALGELGVQARGLVRSNDVIQSAEDIEAIPVLAGRRQPLRFVRERLRWRTAVWRALLWADVVHWHFETPRRLAALDLKIISMLDRPRLVEFWGSDIRIPEVATSDNPYYADVYRQYPELAEGARERSFETQRFFGKHGFVCLIPDSDMMSYVQPDLFGRVHRTRARVMTRDFTPRYPDAGRARPIVVHMPSRKALKGTETIVSVIDQLQRRLDFEFVLIHGMAHREAMQVLSTCDVFVDEIVSGTYGLASIEAMSFGKPTVCYLKPSLLAGCPPGNPIVNASRETLESVLEALLSDGARRHEIGKQSRQFAVEHHDALVVGQGLLDLYGELVRARSG